MHCSNVRNIFQITRPWIKVITVARVIQKSARVNTLREIRNHSRRATQPIAKMPKVTVFPMRTARLSTMLSLVRSFVFGSSEECMRPKGFCQIDNGSRAGPLFFTSQGDDGTGEKFKVLNDIPGREKVKLGQPSPQRNTKYRVETM